MTLVTCAYSPLAIHAMANGCWREWHSEDNNLEGKAVSNVHRKHPVSIAVSMALLAAAASVMASESTGAPAENAGAQGPAQQDVSATPSPDAKKAKSGVAGAGTDAGAKDADELKESIVTVVGVRQSQIRAIEVKRLAPSIQDSISAESIGISTPRSFATRIASG